MTSQLNYQFKTKQLLGETVHRIEVEKPYDMLGGLASDYLSRPEEVADEVKHLERVAAGTLDGWGGGNDNCSYTSEGETTHVLYDFDKHETSLPTAELLRLLRDWLAYLRQQGA